MVVLTGSSMITACTSLQEKYETPVKQLTTGTIPAIAPVYTVSNLSNVILKCEVIED
jgi:hypothetical protein